MNTDIIYIIIVLVVVLISMTLHEAMHAFTGYWLGDDTAKLHGRLSFNPIKHIDPFLTVLLPIMLAVTGAPIFGAAKPVPFNPNNLKWSEWGAAILALAGPLTNLFIAFITFGIWSLVIPPVGSILSQIFVTTIAVNIGFFTFNMIPIPPLDGSRVIYALAPEFVRRGMESMERFGILIVFLIVFLAGPLFSDFMLASLQFFTTVFSNIFIG
jgi:Zn-dependent protease